MTPTRLDAPWLAAETTRAVMDALAAPGKGESRFVGGCVRNTLMGRAVDDVDIATQLEPDEVLAALKAAGIRAVPTGIEHGTVTAIASHRPFEITSLRRDVETDGRRAVVAFTREWSEDAMRRDFRLNAIYAGADGALFDPTGGGIADAASGRVIFIGDADERLREDYLRILRFFRFNAWYAAGIDEAGLAACTRQVSGLRRIAAERIWKELKKLLAAPDPSEAVEAMQRAGVLGAVLPGSEAGGLARLVAIETRYGWEPDPMRRLLVLLPPEAAGIEAFRAACRPSNAELRWLADCDDVAIESERAGGATHWRGLFYRHGTEAVIARAAADAARSGSSFPETAIAAAGDWAAPVFPLSGEDLVKAGLAPGPLLGELLRALEADWIAGDFQAGAADLLADLERQLKRD